MNHENRLYLIGSPTEAGNDIYLESHKTWMSCGSGTATYAQIDSPTPKTLALVGQKVATSWHESWIERWGNYAQTPPTPQIGEALKEYIDWA